MCNAKISVVWRVAQCVWVFIMRPNRCTDFSNLFWNKTLHVSDSSSVYHQEFLHCTHSSGICHRHFAASRIRTELQFRPDPARKLSANLYDIYHCCVYSGKLLKELSKTCRVSFQDKFEKLVHLVGFIRRIYHDTRSPELM